MNFSEDSEGVAKPLSAPRLTFAIRSHVREQSSISQMRRLDRVLTIYELTHICAAHALHELVGSEQATLNAVMAYMNIPKARTHVSADSLEPTDDEVDSKYTELQLLIAGIDIEAGARPARGVSFTADVAYLMKDNLGAARDFGTFLRAVWKQLGQGAEWPRWETAHQDIVTMASDPSLKAFVGRAVGTIDNSGPTGPTLDM